MDLKKGRWMCKKEQKYTATGLPMCPPAIVPTGLDHAYSVRVSFAKTALFPKRTSGGKPVQGHGPVVINEPRKRRIRVEKVFKHAFGQFYGPFYA
jgi:hypothetical protein